MVVRHDGRSALERVLAPAGAGCGPGRRNADGAAGDVVLAALRSQVEQLRVQDQRVRQKVAGSVTRMRVATRRLRSTLRGFSSILDPEHTRMPADELKWLSAQLAEEHDTEVMVERFTEVVRELPQDLILGPPAADPERGPLGQLVEQGERTVQAALDSQRYRALQDMLEQLLNQPPLTQWAGRPALAELPRSVAKAFRKLDRLLDATAALPPGPDRYMTEVVAPVVGEPAHDLHRQTENLQELLGNYQDAVMARPMLQQLGKAAHADGHNAFTYGLLYANEHARTEQVLRELPHRLERLHDEETLSWLQPTPGPRRLASAMRPLRLLNRGRSVGLQARRCISALAAFRRWRWAPQGIDAVARILGIDQVVHGTDRPYAEAVDLRQGAAATAAIRHNNPHRLLYGPGATSERGVQ
jgi:CHAD domain-containing protein